jgi:hypothetical protein
VTVALMRRIVQKSILAGLLSASASLALSFSIVPMLGGQVAGAGLFMTIFCPLAISTPGVGAAFHPVGKSSTRGSCHGSGSG